MLILILLVVEYDKIGKFVRAYIVRIAYFYPDLFIISSNMLNLPLILNDYNDFDNDILLQKLTSPF